MAARNNNVILGVLAVLGALSLIPLLIVWQGYVLHVLWGWFVVPGLGAPAIGVAMAIGLTTTVALVRGRSTKTSDEDSAITGVGQALLTPLLFLGIGWIVKGFL